MPLRIQVSYYNVDINVSQNINIKIGGKKNNEKKP